MTPPRSGPALVLAEPPLRTHARLTLLALAVSGRELMLADGYRTDTCVLATRLVVEAAPALGLALTPLPVQVIAMNAEMEALMASGRPPGEDLCANVNRMSPGGPWRVDIGRGRPAHVERPGWDGHLVAVDRTHRYLVDLSIDQASRPHKNMTFGPTVTELPENWPAEPLALCLRTTGGATIIYGEHPGASPAWRSSVDWTGHRSAHWKRLVGRTVRKTREVLDSQPR